MMNMTGGMPGMLRAPDTMGGLLGNDSRIPSLATNETTHDKNSTPQLEQFQILDHQQPQHH